MANISGFLGRTGNYTNDIIGLNNFQNEWIKAAQDKGITIAGKTSTTFNGTGANLSLLNFSTNPAQNLNNLALTNLNQAGNDTFASILGIGVADSYDGWYTNTTKIRAEINHNPNNGESQELIFKWADNQNITSTTIELSALSPKTPGGEQGNEVGFLQLYNNGTLVSPTNFTIARLNAPLNQKPITISPNGINFIGDRTDGSFKFKIDANPGSGFSFDELRFSAKPYDSPTFTYQNTIFKQDSSDYLVRNISYEGTDDTALPIVTITASDANAAETNSPIAPNPGQFTFTRTGSTASPLTVNYAIAGTADNGSDYSLINNSITFAAGQSSVTLPINVINDTVVEGVETVNLTLAANSAYTVGAANTATVNIADNDTAIDPFVSTGSPSENLLTDALLSPEVFYWNTSLNGGKITYSFLSDAAAGSYYGSETVSEVSDGVKDNVRSILTSLESSLNVDFVEVQDSATNYGVLRYMFSDGPSSVGAYAYAYYPASNTDELSGDVHLSQNFESDPNSSFSGSPGNFGYQVIIHETFHALGLKHPFDDSPTLLPQEDNNTNTVMTYNDDPPYAGSYAITPMAYDLRSLQYLYGAKSNNSGDTTYSFSSVYGYTVNGQFNGSSTTPIKQSLWDSNGSDTLDFSSLPVDNYRFDINQGG
jgi:Calx-beta domain